MSGRRLLLIGAIVLGSLLGCSDPKKVVLSTDETKWEETLKSVSDHLTEDEKRLVAGYLVRRKLGEAFGTGAVTEPVTIAAAIETQRAFEAKQKVEAEKRKAEEAAEESKRQELVAEKELQKTQFREALSVVLLNKGFRKSNADSWEFQEYFTYVFEFANKGAKDIRGFKGLMVFNDLFGDKIYSITLKYDEPIPAGKTVRFEASSESNPYITEQAKFRDTAMKNLKAEFEPEVVIFTDGTRLDLSSSD